jgi:hypothetical protein
VATTPQPPKADLSLNKVLAGAGAAATSAVLGSFFGAEGTVVGAAFGSVASTIATTLYQRSLDRTRDTLVAVVRVRRNAGDPAARAGQADPEMTVRIPPVDADGSVAPVLDEQPPRRRWLLWAGLTVVAFALAMAVITGIELAKGSTITGNESGTSISRAADPRPAAPVEEEPESGSAETTTTATPEPTADPDSSTTATPDPDATGTDGAEGDSDTQQDDEQAPEDDPGGSVDIRPSDRNAPDETPATPDSGSRTGAGTNPGGGAGEGITNRFGSSAGDRFGADDAAPTTAAPPTPRP